jgi:hypothetical protein
MLPEIISRTVAKLGGDDTVKNLKSLAVVADCTGPNGDFVTQVSSLRPDKVLFRQGSARAVTELMVIGEEGWSRNQATREWQSVSEDVVYLARGHEFHLWLLELDKRYHDHQLVGEEMVGDRPCVKMTMKTADNLPAALWIDRDTHLPCQWSHQLPEAFGGEMLRYVLEDWTAVGDLTLFHAFTLYQGDKTYTYNYRSITLNSVDPTLFVL